MRAFWFLFGVAAVLGALALIGPALASDAPTPAPAPAPAGAAGPAITPPPAPGITPEQLAAALAAERKASNDRLEAIISALRPTGPAAAPPPPTNPLATLPQAPDGYEYVILGAQPVLRQIAEEEAPAPLPDVKSENPALEALAAEVRALREQAAKPAAPPTVVTTVNTGPPAGSLPYGYVWNRKVDGSWEAVRKDSLTNPIHCDEQRCPPQQAPCAPPPRPPRERVRVVRQYCPIPVPIPFVVMGGGGNRPDCPPPPCRKGRGGRGRGH